VRLSTIGVCRVAGGDVDILFVSKSAATSLEESGLEGNALASEYIYDEMSSALLDRIGI